MNRGLTLLGAAGLGAGLMYFLDPVLGRRRRALVRDQAVSALAHADDLVGKTGRDLANRAAGFAAETSARFRDQSDASDTVLADRARAAIGRVCSHPSSVDVTVRDGRVTLSGPILADEVSGVFRAVRSVPGVTGVEDRLGVHEEAGNVPGLQGQGKPPGARLDLMQANWAPATRLIAGAVGGSLMVNCLARRTPLAVFLGTAGFGLFLRAVTNMELRQLLGMGDARGGFHFTKTVTVAAPFDRVFDFWSDLGNFPRIMAHVRQVQNLGGGRSRWTVEGPAGVPIHWDATITRYEQNRLLAWETAPGSPVAHAGVVHFEPVPGGTRIQVEMSYAPPAGVLGHAVAALFGADPKREMDDDLLRMKTFLETGIPARDAALPSGRR
jgi:uncharacterized membrane protein